MDSIRDWNYVAVEMAVSSIDQTVTLPLLINPTSWGILAESVNSPIDFSYVNDDGGYSWVLFTSVSWIDWGTASPSFAGVNDYWDANSF